MLLLIKFKHPRRFEVVRGLKGGKQQPRFLYQNFKDFLGPTRVFWLLRFNLLLMLMLERED